MREDGAMTGIEADVQQKRKEKLLTGKTDVMNGRNNFCNKARK